LGTYALHSFQIPTVVNHMPTKHKPFLAVAQVSSQIDF